VGVSGSEERLLEVIGWRASSVHAKEDAPAVIRLPGESSMSGLSISGLGERRSVAEREHAGAEGLGVLELEWQLFPPVVE
jgi:hypothetical protein